MDETEFGLDCTETFLGSCTMGLLLNNLDTEIVVGITFEAFISVSGNLILPVGLSDGRANVVRVQAAVRRSVIESQHGTIFNEDRTVRQAVPYSCTVERLSIYAKRLSLVLKKPQVVFVLVGIQGDLLLFATGGIHERMGVEVAALGVDVADAHAAAKCDVGSNIVHALVVESCLEFGAHEAIALAWVDQAEEVNSEHGHVEGDGNNDEAESPSHQVLAPKSHRDVLVVAQKDPELKQSQRAYPGNGEQANPFDADSDTQSQTGHGEPEPPSRLEGLGRAKLMLVREAGEGEGGEGSGGDQGGIE